MDGFKILIEAAKKKRRSIDTTKARHPKVGFAGYAYGSNPGDRPNETNKFNPTLGPGPSLPDPTPIHQQGEDNDHSGVIVMGNGAGGGGGSVGPVTALTGGDGGAGGGACGESVEADQISAIIESYRTANPNSDIMTEIKNVFDGIKQGNGILYHSCDGAAAINQNTEIPPTSDAQVAALAASCEASLNAFKQYTGFDYTSWRG